MKCSKQNFISRTKIICLTAYVLFFIMIVNLLSAQNRNAMGIIVGGTRPPDMPVIADKPLPTWQPAGNQKPAFEGQTKAPAVITKTKLKAEVITDRLHHPWSIAFLPDGRMFITEKRGTLRIVSPLGLVSDTLRGLPKVYFRGDGGLLDIVLDPDFAANRTFYIAYVEQRSNGNGISVASAILSYDEFGVSGVKVIFRVEPDYPNWAHYGSRLLFNKDGTLFVSTGERTDAGIRVQAQWLSSHLGKLLRINKDGSPAKDNPSFPDSANARPEVYAYGFRNGQALTFNPETGDLWEMEHGPQGGDEINIIKPGKNYGWPVIAYGTEYSGNLINGGKSAQDGMEQPIYYWNPAIAPSGATFYTGTLIPEWKGNLFAAALAGQHLSRLVIKNNKVVGEERLLPDQHQRMRDVKQAPDGSLWVITDADNGRLIRIGPK